MRKKELLSLSRGSEILLNLELKCFAIADKKKEKKMYKHLWQSYQSL